MCLPEGVNGIPGPALRVQTETPSAEARQITLPSGLRRSLVRGLQRRRSLSAIPAETAIATAERWHGAAERQTFSEQRPRRCRRTASGRVSDVHERWPDDTPHPLGGSLAPKAIYQERRVWRRPGSRSPFRDRGGLSGLYVREPCRRERPPQAARDGTTRHNATAPVFPTPSLDRALYRSTQP